MRLPMDASRRERLALAAAMALSFAVVVLYVLARRDQPLVGDELEYHLQGMFFTDGKWWWSTTPFGVAHESMWKAPLYPAFVGFWYSLLGDHADRVELVQALLAPLTVLLTWLLARRLFSPRVAIASAFVVALFPFVFEYFGLLYAEALAIPLTVLVLLLFLDREATPGRAAIVGLLMGVCILVRPTSFFLFAGIAVAWILASGWRRGAALTALSVGLAALVVVPWTIRNYVVTDDFVPISVQDGALAGTFNPESASDPAHPYAWRPITPSIADIFDPANAVDDGELRSKLQDRAFDYISDHPDSVPKAFFWNGLSRFWDVRSPGEVTYEVPFEGRSKPATSLGLLMYWILLPLAIFGIWRVRDRREIWAPVVALAAAACVVFTVASGTRYRAPLEPLIVILACSAIADRLPWPKRRDASLT